MLPLSYRVVTRASGGFPEVLVLEGSRVDLGKELWNPPDKLVADFTQKLALTVSEGPISR